MGGCHGSLHLEGSCTTRCPKRGLHCLPLSCQHTQREPCSHSARFEQALLAFQFNACRIHRRLTRLPALVSSLLLLTGLVSVRACNVCNVTVRDAHWVYRKGWQDDFTFPWYSTVCQRRKDTVQHGGWDPTMVKRQSRGKRIMVVVVVESQPIS